MRCKPCRRFHVFGSTPMQKTSASRQLRRPYNDAHVFERCGPLIVKQRHPRELRKRKRTPCFIFTCRTGCTPSLLRPAQPPSVASSQVEEVINNTSHLQSLPARQPTQLRRPERVSRPTACRPRRAWSPEPRRPFPRRRGVLKDCCFLVSFCSKVMAEGGQNKPN